LHCTLSGIARDSLFSSFLDDIDRITAPEYAPSDQDIVRARLRTTGVQEHHFKLDRGILSFVVTVSQLMLNLQPTQPLWTGLYMMSQVSWFMPDSG